MFLFISALENLCRWLQSDYATRLPMMVPDRCWWIYFAQVYVRGERRAAKRTWQEVIWSLSLFYSSWSRSPSNSRQESNPNHFSQWSPRGGGENKLVIVRQPRIDAPTCTTVYTFIATCTKRLMDELSSLCTSLDFAALGPLRMMMMMMMTRENLAFLRKDASPQVCG